MLRPDALKVTLDVIITGPGFPRVLGGRIDMGAIEADFDRLFADRFEDHSQ